MAIVHKLTSILFFTIISFSIVHPENAVRGLLKSSNISPDDIYANQWALIIGINQYKDFPQLNYAVEDAKSMKTLLSTQYGFPDENILLLLDEDATKIKIEDAFYNLSENAGPDDAVIVFFAGHGETEPALGGTEDLGYLIPVDGKQKSLHRSSLDMKTINIHSSAIPAKSILFLVDACYGGLAAVGQFRSNRKYDYIKNLTKDRSRQIITAGKKNEQVVENEKWQHSAFTKVLLEGLMELKADTDEDGIIIANQLYSFIQSNVLILTEGKQTPQFEQLTADEGEFAFIDQNLIIPVEPSSIGFLAIITEPFDALVKVDDVLISKKTPFMDEKIEGGYHTITVLKKGYKEFSIRSIFKPNKTTKINPAMKLIEGIVSFSSLPKDSHIRIDGESVGTTPLDNMNLEQGLHPVEVTIPGYEKIPLFDLNIDSSIVYPLTLPRLFSKTKMKAFIRSAIVPGWGQRYYEKPKKSTGFGTAALLSGLFCIYNQLQYSQLSADYENAVADYQNSGDPESKVDHMLNMYDQLVINEKNTNLGVYDFSGIYAVNLIDILLEKPFANSVGFSDGKVESDVKVGITPNGPGLKIGIRF